MFDYWWAHVSRKGGGLGEALLIVGEERGWTGIDLPMMGTVAF